MEKKITAVLQAKVSGFIGSMKQAQDSVRSFATDFETKAQQIESRNEKVLQSLGTVGKGMTVAGAGVALGLGKAVKASMGFNQQMSKVQALSGATNTELGQLKNSAMEAGASTKFSAVESGQAFEYMALAGWTTEEMLSGLDGVIKLATASGEDLARTSDIVTDGLSMFGLGADDAAGFADVLAKASTTTNTSVSEIGESLKYAGASANAFGMDIGEAAGFVGLLANNGIKGSSAGTVLNAVLRDMQKNAKDGKIAIGEQAVAIYDAEGNARTFSDVLKDVEDATKGMSDEQKNAALSAVFGDEAMRGMNIAMSEGVDELIRLESEMANAAGTTDEMSRIMQDNLAGDLTNLSSALEGAAINIGNVLEPAIRKVVQALDQLVTWFNSLSTEAHTVVAVVGLIASAFLLLVGPIFIIVSMIPSFLAGLATIGVAFSSTTAIILGAVALIGAAAALIYIYWEPIKEFFVNLWGTIVEVFQMSIEAISSLLGGVGSVISGALGGLVDMFSSLAGVLQSVDIASVFERLSAALSVVAGVVLGLLGPWGVFAGLLLKIAQHTTIFQDALSVLKGEMEFSELVSNATNAITSLIDGFVEGAAKLIPVGAEMLVNLIEGFASGYSKFATIGMELITSLVDSIVSAMPAIQETAITVITTMIEAYTTAIPMLLEVGITIITTLIEAIVTALPMLIEVAIMLIETIIEAIVTALPMLIEVAILLITTLVEAFVTAIPMLVEVAVTIVTTLLDAIIAALPALLEAGIQIITTLVEGIITLIPELITAAIDIIMTLIEGLISALPMVIEAAVNIIMALVEGLITAAPLIIGAAVLLIAALVKGLIQLIPQLIQAGVQLITALVKGIIQLVPQLIQAGIQLVQALFKAIIQLVPLLLTAGIQLITALVGGVLQMLGALISAGVSLITSLLSAILGFAGSMLSAGVSLLTSLVSGVLSMVGALISAGASLITAFVNRIIQFGSNMMSAGRELVDKLKAAVTGKVSEMASVGKDLVQGMINGIKNMAGAAVEAITGVVGGVVDKAKSLLRIKSPSRVFMGIGSDTIEGMEIGMKSRRRKLEGVMTELTDGIKAISVNHVAEEKAITKKANEEKALVEKRASEDILKIERAARAKKRKLTEDELIKVRRIHEDANKKTKQIEAKAQKEITKLIEGEQKERLEYIKNYVADKQSLEQLSLVEEVKIWEESVKRFKDGTKQKIQAQQEYKKAVEKLEKELLEINEKYQKEMKRVDEEAADAIKESTKRYEDAYRERFNLYDSLGSTFDDFVVKQKYTSDDLLINLENQVSALLEWDKAMEEIEGKIQNRDLLAELYESGPKALGELRTLNEMSASELDQFVKLYEQKFSLASDMAYEETKDLKDKHYQEVKEIQENAKEQAEKLTHDWQINMAELVGVSDKQLKSLKQVGVNAGQGLYEGLESMRGPLMSLARDIANGIRDTIQSALDIHSPSRVMRGLGRDAGEGLYLGLNDTVKDVESTADRLAKGIQGAGDVRTGGGVGGVTQNITVVSPEPTNAYENARAFKRAQQQLGLEW